MTKFFKILILNLILFIFVFILAEIFCYSCTLFEAMNFIKDYNKPIDPKIYAYKIIMRPYKEYYKYVLPLQFRKPVGLNFNKKPILLLGCSYTFGDGLTEEETFSYKLSQYTKRPVYNKGVSGGGIQHAILMAQDPDFYNSVQEPEYVIFVYNSNLHIIRMHLYIFSALWDSFLYPRFVLKDDKLVQAEDKKAYCLYLYKMYKNYEAKNNSSLNEQNCYFASKHFELLKSEFEKHWKNTKFVILFYDQGFNSENYDCKLKEELKKMNYIVLDTKELTGVVLNNEYQISKTDSHPNAKAWELVVPEIAKVLNL